MLLYINEKNIKPNVENNIFDFQPYISKYKDEPLNNFKNEFNGSLQTQNLQVSNVYTPKTKEYTSIVKSYLNTINIDKSKGKINNKPIADFDYTLKDGEIILRNLSSDPDNDDLIYSWNISDNVSFSSKNVRYSFQHRGMHEISLLASDGELTDIKKISVTIDDTSGFSEYILINFKIKQNGATFEIEDNSETKNIFEYERTWFLDGQPLEEKTDKITLTLEDRQPHKIGLRCKGGKFEDYKENTIYANLEPIISTKIITIREGQSVELSAENSFSINDPIKSYTWSTDDNI